MGQWGEIQLRRVVELAGISEHCDFVEQPTSEGSRGHPDMVVKLPNGRAVVVDAKASTAAFLEARTASDDAAAKEALGSDDVDAFAARRRQAFAAELDD